MKVNDYLADKNVKEAWINSWNRDPYQGACIYYTSNKNEDVGAITEGVCTAKRYALCQQ
jgi:hypothetical protein